MFVADQELAERPLELIEREIESLAARITAGSARWLELVAEFDRREGWGGTGCRSTCEWVAWRCALTPRSAREHVRVARALRELPLIREAFGAGALSYSKVRALTRVADPEGEAELVELARHATAAQLERMVRAARRVTRGRGRPTAARELPALVLGRRRRVPAPRRQAPARGRGALPPGAGRGARGASRAPAGRSSRSLPMTTGTVPRDRSLPQSRAVPRNRPCHHSLRGTRATAASAIRPTRNRLRRSPNAPSPARRRGSAAGSETSSSCTSTPPPWPPTPPAPACPPARGVAPSPTAPGSRPRPRGASPATAPWSRWSSATARRSASGEEPAPSRPRFAARWRCATGGVSSRAASATASSTPTTSSTGRAGRPDEPREPGVALSQPPPARARGRLLGLARMARADGAFATRPVPTSPGLPRAATESARRCPRPGRRPSPARERE